MSFLSMFCRHLGSQLAELENIIERMLQEDFGKCVSSDLNRPIADTEPLMEEVRQSLTLNHAIPAGSLL